MRKLILAAVGAITVLAVMAVGALAHSRPIRFDPAPGAVLSAAPAQITGWFTSDLRRDPNWTFIHVTNAAGERVDTGDAVLSADRREITVDLQSGLPDGRYLVTWRNYDDADGHILGDCYVFYVGQAAADAGLVDKTRIDGGGDCERADISAREATPAPGASLVETETPASSADGDSSGSDVPLWLLVIGVAGGVAVGLVGSRFLIKSGPRA